MQIRIYLQLSSQKSEKLIDISNMRSIEYFHNDQLSTTVTVEFGNKSTTRFKCHRQDVRLIKRAVKEFVTLRQDCPRVLISMEKDTTSEMGSTYVLVDISRYEAKQATRSLTVA